MSSSPAQALLREACARGLELQPEGKGLRVRGRLDPDLRERLRHHKGEILGLLRRAASPIAKLPPLEPGESFAIWLLLGDGSLEKVSGAGPGPGEGACGTCGRQQWWLSVHGAVVCGVCHPPATRALVASWIEAEANGAGRRMHDRALRGEGDPAASAYPSMPGTGRRRGSP